MRPGRLLRLRTRPEGMKRAPGLIGTKPNRQIEGYNMQFNRKLPGAILALGLISVMLAACGGGQTENAGQSPTVESVITTPVSTGGKTGRTDRVSAASLEKGEGTDFCDRYPVPVAEPFSPNPASIFALLPNEYSRGAEEPVVSIIMYGDFQCADCAPLALALAELVERHPDEVRVTFRHLPALATNDKALMAAEAVEAAAAQDGVNGFWAMHDLLYARQAEWVDLAPSSFFSVLANYADELGLDAEQFSSELSTGKYTNRIEFAVESINKIPGINEAPVLLVNDEIFDQPPGDVEVLDIVYMISALSAQYNEAPPMEIDPEKDYVAWIETEHGDIAVNLFADLAPVTVNNFAYLACSGYYDDITWHRVIAGFMAQAGDPTETGYAGPGYTIPDEFEDSALTFDREGWLSMAHTTEPDSAGGQFFITYDAAEHLNGSFTIFGQVAAGMDILRSITPRDPAATNDPGDKLITIIVREIN